MHLKWEKYEKPWSIPSTFSNGEFTASQGNSSHIWTHFTFRKIFIILNQKIPLKFQPWFKPERLYRTNLISLWQFISSYEEKDHVLSGNVFPPVNVSNSLPLPSDDKILNSLSLKPMCFSFKSCSKSRKTGE